MSAPASSGQPPCPSSSPMIQPCSGHATFGRIRCPAIRAAFVRTLVGEREHLVIRIAKYRDVAMRAFHDTRAQWRNFGERTNLVPPRAGPASFHVFLRRGRTDGISASFAAACPDGFMPLKPRAFRIRAPLRPPRARATDRARRRARTAAAPTAPCGSSASSSDLLLHVVEADAADVVHGALEVPAFLAVQLQEGAGSTPAPPRASSACRGTARPRS